MRKIKIVIKNHDSYLHGYCPKSVFNNLRRSLSYRVQNAEFSNAYNTFIKKDGRYVYDEFGKKMRRWDGRKYLITKDKDKITVKTGLLGRAIKILKENDIQTIVVDCREKPKKDLDLKLAQGRKPRDYQQETVDQAAAMTRGIIKIATGGGKCLGKGTPVMMYDGSIKVVENVRVGDFLMGPDSKPRYVSSTCQGWEELYRVIPVKGDSYVVNKSHILSLMINDGKKEPFIRNLTVTDYLNSNDSFKHIAKGYRVGVDFKFQEVEVDPYFIGLWLGDGSSESMHVTTADDEVKKYLMEYAKSKDLNYHEKIQKNNKSVVCKITVAKGSGVNPLLDEMRRLGVVNNKHIPHEYKCNSREVRMQVFAGLMDSDGHRHHGGYDYVSKSKVLADDVAFLARSLGLAAYVKPCRKKCYNNGAIGDYYRVSISGDCSDVPVKLKRKKCKKRLQKKNVLVTGITVEPIGEGEYYGFEIDQDKLFLLGDFTVTHNTPVAAFITAHLGLKGCVFLVSSKDLLYQAKKEFEEFITLNGEPLKVGIVGDGNCDIQDITICTDKTACLSFGVKYVEPDENEESSKESEDKDEDHKAKIRDMIRNCKLLFVDEVHHVACDTMRDLLQFCQNTYYRFGLSASPWRDDGADLEIESFFGKYVVDISASFLIQGKYLVKPTIYMTSMEHEDIYEHSTYPTIYKKCISECAERNDYIRRIAERLVDDNYITLILVRNISHGKELEKIIDGSVFVSGSSGKKKRKEALDRLRDGQYRVVIASSIFDEGIDAKSLSALILAGSGKSSTRALQRVGRVIRTYPNKNRAIVVDILDHVKYLEDHSKKRVKMYKTEKEFDIRTTDFEQLLAMEAL